MSNSKNKKNWRVVYCLHGYSAPCLGCSHYEDCITYFNTYDEALDHFVKVIDNVKPEVVSLQYVKHRNRKVRLRCE